MTYTGRHLADSFRTVRKNTITIAEEIPAEKYDFRPASGLRSVGEQLAHVTVAPRWQIDLHSSSVTLVTFEYFGRHLAQAAAEEQMLRTKDEILAALREDGEAFASFCESLSDATLAEIVAFPPPVQPSEKSRLEMLMATKEHEMHHRAQLMLVQRLLGIVPHLTRAREQMAAVLAPKA
jgi:uncharacterized damage-inducible protein DinB